MLNNEMLNGRKPWNDIEKYFIHIHIIMRVDA